MIILASTSSARRRLLKAAGVEFESIAPKTDEKLLKSMAGNVSPAQLAKHLAEAKAQSLRQAFPHNTIIGCDQVLACQDRLFEKPNDMDEAFGHLSILQGKTHILHTAAVCLEPGQQPASFTSEPTLKMRTLTPDEIHHYLATSGSAILSCVGCYQIEATGVRLFEAINGDIFSIQGLPLLPLLSHLRERGLLT